MSAVSSGSADIDYLPVQIDGCVSDLSRETKLAESLAQSNATRVCLPNVGSVTGVASFTVRSDGQGKAACISDASDACETTL